MKLFSLILLFVSTNLATFADDGEYAVSKINAALLKRANAVLRLEEINFEVVNVKHTIERNHFVITILNENGEDWASLYENYYKHREIVSIEGYLYDATGKQLKKIKNSKQK